MDTNQIIAGSLWPSGPAGFILDTGHEAADYLKKIFAYNGKLVDPKEKIDVIKNDPTDNMFLDAAVEGKADFIVSRDNDLLKLKNFRGIEIISPEAMTKWIRSNIK